MGWMLVKYLLIYFLYYSGVIFLYSFIRRYLKINEITILTYHRVLDIKKEGCDFSTQGMVVSIKTFQKQLDYLHSNYNIISLERLQEIIENKAKLPEKACMITFDDGWKDNYINAFPILKERNIPAIIFLTTNYINGTDVFWYTKLLFILINGNWVNIDFRKIDAYRFPEEFKNELKVLVKLNEEGKIKVFDNCIEIVKYCEDSTQQKIIDDLSELLDVKVEKLENKNFFLTWDEVKKMTEHNITFGSHTLSHRILTTINDNSDIKKELIESKNTFEKHIKKPITTFAYPNGNWNLDIKELVKQTGYKLAFTLDGNLASLSLDSHSLSRINIHEASSKGINGGFSHVVFLFELSGFKRNLNKLRFIKKQHKR